MYSEHNPYFKGHISFYKVTNCLILYRSVMYFETLVLGVVLLQFGRLNVFCFKTFVSYCPVFSSLIVTYLEIPRIFTIIFVESCQFGRKFTLYRSTSRPEWLNSKIIKTCPMIKIWG